MNLSLDDATLLANLQKRIKAAALREADPFTNNIQTATATAGLIREAANICNKYGALQGDAVRLNQRSQAIFAAKLAGKEWQTLAAAAAGTIGAVLIKTGFRTLDSGAIPPSANLPGPSIFQQQDTVLMNPQPIVSGTPTTTPRQTVQAQVTDMATDPITGVEDPISDDVTTLQTRGDFDVIGAIGGALQGYAGGGGITGAAQGALTGGAGGQVFPNGTSQTPGITAQPTQQAGGYLSGILQNLLGGGSGGDGGGALPGVPGVFDITDIYNMLGGAGAGAGAGGNLPMLPGVVAPTPATRLKAPKGYVIVTVNQNDPFYANFQQAGAQPQPDGTLKIAMLKEIARKRGYWKPRPKPALTSGDMKTIRRAATLKKKVARAYLKAGVSPKDLKEVKSC